MGQTTYLSGNYHFLDMRKDLNLRLKARKQLQNQNQNHTED